MENKMVTTTEQELTTPMSNMPLGFEDEDAGDVIIPRVKVIQTLSPERKEKVAEEGDIINSLTKEKLNGKVFVPVFMFKNNVHWRDRSDGGGIMCIARDGRLGEKSDGTTAMCAQCRMCEFDNSRQGREAVPKCTKYINFFGFFAGEMSPIILSFSKTSYNEGKKLFSLAKVMMQNMWNFGYRLDAKLLSKGNNEWYIPVMTAAGATTEEDRTLGASLYNSFRGRMSDVAFDMEDNATPAASAAAASVDPNSTEF